MKRTARASPLLPWVPQALRVFILETPGPGREFTALSQNSGYVGWLGRYVSPTPFQGVQRGVVFPPCPPLPQRLFEDFLSCLLG